MQENCVTAGGETVGLNKSITRWPILLYSVRYDILPFLIHTDLVSGLVLLSFALPSAFLTVDPLC